MSLTPDPDAKHGEPSTPAETKKNLRQTLLETRKKIRPLERSRFDREIGNQVSLYLASRHFTTIGVYLPIRNEPDLSTLYAELSGRMQLSLPVTLAKDQPLQFVRWKPGDTLIKGAYNVSIPEKQEPVSMPEILLIPCVGFTSSRFRLGYGGGFFDRTLEKYPDTHTVGIAYSRLLTTFETEENDIPLHCIITETGIVL
ncbi:5-formyltetrahydrofolate cyclo-ligase [Oxalobacter paraformigenes]|uniref:5-formyltetrahydrofolate cyclo-ligase n=1 Tax=Oxalobacter paraformigenes TaxID=556268 RepID=C3X680_9BURK|nr:5-formyltetrahydrofolate cyclo-ligase [Oxalobacter paraformigenes]EEO28716.1 5-formyltetrahydrofolate cyclo-ligase [Oxalobacter paraformigenes]